MINLIDNKQNNFLNCNFTTEKNNETKKSFSEYTEEEEKKISQEEDEVLYNYLKAAGAISSKEELNEYKKKFSVTFPPDSAPGSVRRAWRLAKENASPEMRKEMDLFHIFYYSFLREDPNYMSNMKNDVNGYSNMTKDMKKYAEEYNNTNDPKALGQYKWYSKILQSFDTELEKFL